MLKTKPNVDVVEAADDFFAQKSEPNSDEEQLDDRPFLSHRIAEDQESFSEKFLRNILTYDYQNKMPRRREKFVEIVKTVTVTEIVNGAPDKHPSSCEVKVTNLSPSGPHPVNVSIKHLNEKWRSSESLESEKGTIIQIQETHQPYYQKENNSNLNMKKRSSSTSYKEEETIRTKVEKSSSTHRSSSHHTPLFNKSSDNIIDLEFTHPILVETSPTQSNGTRAFANLRKRLSKTTKLETTETEKVTTTRKRSSSAQPEVRTLYYRKFIDTNNESDGESSGSMIDHEDRSRSAEPPRAPPRKRLGREESLHYYREDGEVQRDGVTSVSINDSYDSRNITAGITTVSVNDSCTDTSFESRFSTIPRSSTHHIHVNVIGPERSSSEDISIHIDRRRRRSSSEAAPPKPPRRAKYDTFGEPLATSTPMTTIERKISRRPPDINIEECETVQVKSPARTPIVVVNQTPTSRRPSQDILSTTERRRKSTVTDIDWYAAFNMKEPSRGTLDDRKEIPVRRRASESSIAIPPADIDLNQVFICTKIRRSDDEKCQCNACQLIRLSENERRSRSTTRQRTSSRVFNRTFSEYTTTTLPNRHSTPPVEIVLDEIFNPKPKPPMAPPRKKLDDIFNNENHREDIDQSKVRSSTINTTNTSHADQLLHSRDKPIPQDGEIRTTTTLKMTSDRDINWVDEMMQSTKDWERSTREPSKYIVTRKQRAQDVEALDFEENSRRLEVTIPIIPTEEIDKQVEEVLSSGPTNTEVSIELNNQLTNAFVQATANHDVHLEEQSTTHVTTTTSTVNHKTSSVIQTSNVNLEDVFNVSFTRDEDDVSDEKLKQRISEFEKNKADKQHQDEPVTHVTTSSVNLDDSRISIDDVFNLKPVADQPRARTPAEEETVHRPPPSPAEPSNVKSRVTSLSEVTIQLNNELMKESETSEVVSNATQNLRTSEQTSSSSDVHTVALAHQDESVPEFEKPLEDEPLTHVTTSSVNLHDSRTPIEGVLNLKPREDDETIHRPPPSPAESSNIESAVTSLTEVTIQLNNELAKEPVISQELSPVQLPALTTEPTKLVVASSEPTVSTSTVNLDDVFNVSFTHDEDDVSDEKLKQRIAEFEKNKADKKHQDEPVTHVTTSSVNLDDSRISIDDVFNLKPSDHPSAEQSSNETKPMKIHKEDNIHQPSTSELPSKPAIESPTKLNSESVNLDDVFNTSFNDGEKDDVDEKLKQRIAEFENNKADKKHQEVPEIHVTTSNVNLDYSNVNINDVFVSEPVPIKQTEEETVHRPPPSPADPSDHREPVIPLSEITFHLNKNLHDDSVELSSVTQEVGPSKVTQLEPEQKSPTSGVNLDDVFNASFTQDEDDVSDEKLKQRIAEFEKNKDDKKHQDEPITHVPTSSATLDDSKITIDDVFNLHPAIEPESIDRISLPTENYSIQRTASISDVETHLNNELEETSSVTRRPIVRSYSGPEETPSSLNLDDVFNVSFSHGEDDVSDEKLKSRIAEFEKNKADKKHQDEPESHTETSNVNLDDSTISIDDVFNLKTPVINTTSQDFVLAPEDFSEKTSHPISEEIPAPEIDHPTSLEELNVVENFADSTASDILDEIYDSGIVKDIKDAILSNHEQPVQPSTSVNLDDVFNVSFTHQDDDVDDETLKHRIAEFEKNKHDKQHPDEPVDHVTTSNGNFDDSKISIDDVFGLKPIDHAHAEESSKGPSEIPVQHTEPALVPSQQTTTPATGVNLDDIFNVSFNDHDDDVSDEKLKQRIAEFEKNKKDKQHRDEPATHVITSSENLDDLRITIDDVFNVGHVDHVPETSTALPGVPVKHEELPIVDEPVVQHTPEQPSNVSHQLTTSASVVNLDDVFSASFAHDEDEVSDEKLKQRIAEFEKNKADKKHQDEPVIHLTTSSVNLNDSRVSIDDEFDLKPVIEERKSALHEIPEPVVPVDSEKQTPAITSASQDLQASHEQPFVPQHQPTTAMSTVNLEDVFNASFTREEDDVSEEKLKQRIAEFEKNKADKKHQDEPETHVTTSSVNLDDSRILIDDVFNVTPVHNVPVQPKVNDDDTSSISIDLGKEASADVRTTTVEPKKSPSNLNLDDVFNVSFKHEEDNALDEKLKQRVEEFEKNKSDKQREEEPISHVATSSVNLDDSTISIDDVFGPKPVEATHYRTSEVPSKHREPKSDVTMISSVPTITHDEVEPTTSTSTVNLEEVFNVNFTHDEDEVSDEKLKQRIAEFEKNKADKKHDDEPVTHMTTSNLNLDDSRISIDDVFNLKQVDESSNVPTGIPFKHLEPVSEPAKAVEQTTSTSTVNLDDVFSVSFNYGEDDVDDEKLKQRIGEFENSKADKTHQDESAIRVTTSSVNLDDSKISIDNVFDLKPVDHAPLEETSTSFIGVPRESQRPSTLTPMPTTSTSTVNLDDVFNVSFTHDDEDVSDEKLKQRIGEFEKNKADKKHQDEPVTHVTTSSVNLDDSRFSIEDVFDLKPVDHSLVEKTEIPIRPQEPSNVGEESSEPTKTPEEESKPKTTTTTSTVNLEDVFNVSFTHEEDDVSDEKLKQRIAEFDKNKKDKQHQDEPATHVATSSVNLDDSTISIDDAFDLKQVDHAPVEEKSTSSTGVPIKHQESFTQPRDTVEQTSTPSQQPTTSTSTVHLEDVFNVSFTHDEDDVSDEKLKQRIAEFEKNKNDKKYEDEPVTHVTSSSVNLDDSRISIEDVYNLKPVEKKPFIPPAEFPIRHRESNLDEIASTSTTTVNLDNIFNVSFTHEEDDVSDEKLNQRIAEFEKNKVDKKNDDAPVTHVATSSVNLDDSRISIDDVFNIQPSKSTDRRISIDLGKETTSQVESTSSETVSKTSRTVNVLTHTDDQPETYLTTGNVDLPDSRSKLEELYFAGIRKDIEDSDDVFNVSITHQKKEAPTPVNLDDIFSTTTTTEKTEETTTEEVSEETTTVTKKSGQYYHPSSTQKPPQTSTSTLQIVTEDKFNTSKASTISLDDSFTRRKLPDIDVNNLDSIYLSPPMTNPRSQKIQDEGSVSSPTRISQEIKYEWIADILSPASTVISSAYIDLGEKREVESDRHPTTSFSDQIPSTSSPTPETTRTYHRSPRVSETITTSHRWNDAPMSPRRYSNFYEERKSISAAGAGPDQDEADEMYDEYNDFYISSVKNQEVDIDVSHFVDDILGRSLDEAAFLSSTKSLDFKKHTDTSIDRKKKPTGQEQGQQDDLLNLVFNQSTSEEPLFVTKKEESRNDEEMLEIEQNPEYFIVKGSYSLVIPKTDPLGQLLSKLSEEHELASLDFSLTRKLKAMLLECIKERATKEHRSEHQTISTRGQHLLSSVDNASATFLKMNDNKYNVKKNPKGIINFCTAENNLCTPLLEERFKHLELFIPNTDHLVRYPPSGGWPETREALCAYFQHFMNARVEPDELVLTASTRTGYDVVCHCLFEPHDILLTNGPIYTGTISNPNERAQCVVECVPTDLKKPKLDISEFQKLYDHLTKEKDQVVSGVIIVNPHNPLGVVFPPEEVIELSNWASKLNLKVVIDEVFANCVYDKDSRFKSYLSYRHRVSRPENVTYLWSVSKDFGLPGLKFAVIHTNDESLKIASTKLQYYYPCSAMVQDFTVKLLSDFDWLKTFHSEVQRRIRIHYVYTSENLKNLQIPFIPAQAGIFVFADFSHHLEESSESAELQFWNRLAEEVGVMLTPGVHQKCHKLGWFRLVFACTAEELEEGFKRLYKFLRIRTKPLGAIDYLL